MEEESLVLGRFGGLRRSSKLIRPIPPRSRPGLKSICFDVSCKPDNAFPGDLCLPKTPSASTVLNVRVFSFAGVREGPQTGWTGPRAFHALRMAEARKVWVNQNRGPLTRSDSGAFPGLNI